ncbi:MAG: sensor histidine kinase [Vulcanimicrobiota bacterium]
MRNPFRTIRWQLIGSSLLAIGIPLLIFSTLLATLLWGFFLQELEGRLRSDAFLIAEDVVPLLAGGADVMQLETVVDRWDRHTGIRLIIADQKGIVRAGTAGFASLAIGHPVTEDLAPGLADAVHGHDNSTTWKSPQRDYEETMYVNVPVHSGDQIVGAVRVSYSLRQVLEKVRRIRRSLIAGVTAYAVLIVALTFWLATNLARPVEALNRGAQKLARGDLEERVPVEGTVEVEELARTLNAMAERLQGLEGLRRRYVSDVSHELRAPLAAIRGMAETMVTHGEEDPALNQRFLPRIITQTDRLARLATQLLDLAQIESGNLASTLSDVDLHEVVDEAVSTARQGRGPEKAVEVGLEPGLPNLRADRDRLVQMLLNLVDNALRHTPDDKCVRVMISQQGSRVEIVVADEGPGIAPEHLPHLFERFYRVDAARNVKVGGAGLGLSIVHQIVRVHGGKIAVESNLGEGTTFRILLPVEGPGARRESGPAS